MGSRGRSPVGERLFPPAFARRRSPMAGARGVLSNQPIRTRPLLFRQTNATGNPARGNAFWGLPGDLASGHKEREVTPMGDPPS